MDRFESAALDRHITGNYGEDFFKNDGSDDPDAYSEMDPEPEDLGAADESWYEDRGNLALLVEYLADQGDNPSELGRAVEKPWQYEEDFLQAQNWANDRADK